VGVLSAAISCDATPPPDARPAAPTTAIDAPQARPEAEVAASDPWSRALAARVLVDGRLGPGTELVALDTLAAPDGAPSCATCSTKGTSTLFVASSLDDAADHEILRDLDAMFRYYADDGLAGVMVLAPANGDRLITPEDPRAAIDRALALRDRLHLAIDVRVPARVDDGGNRAWDEWYAVAGAPLVLLVGPEGRVTFSGTTPSRERWSALDRAIVDALAGRDEVVAKSPMP
jgi:hypothetical protein